MQRFPSKIILLSFGLLFLSSLGLICGERGRFFAFPFFSGQKAGPWCIAITQIVDHPSLDAIRQGILDRLEEGGITPGKNVQIVYENAQGNIAIARQVAQKFLGLNPTLVIALTTPSAQAVVSVMGPSLIPIIFGAISDPVGAQIVSSLGLRPENITGTRDSPPLEGQLNLMRHILPSLKRLGVIYSSGEVNAAMAIETLKELGHRKGIEVIAQPIQKTSDVSTAAKTLAPKVEAFFLALDNGVASSLEALLYVAKGHNLPVFASDPDSVRRGALAALCYDQYDIGRQTGRMVLEVLRGGKPSQMPVEEGAAPKVYINSSVGQALGLRLPPLSQAIDLAESARALLAPLRLPAPTPSLKVDLKRASASLSYQFPRLKKGLHPTG